MLSTTVLAVALASILSAPAEQVHRVWFLGWLEGGNDFAYAEVIQQGTAVQGTVRVHSVSTARARNLCRLPGESARKLLASPPRTAFSDPGCGAQKLVREPLAMTGGRAQAPDKEAVFELVRAYNASGLDAYQNEEYESASVFFRKSARRDPDFQSLRTWADFQELFRQ
jgi:hypothetical protein